MKKTTLVTFGGAAVLTAGLHVSFDYNKPFGFLLVGFGVYLMSTGISFAVVEDAKTTNLS